MFPKSFEGKVVATFWTIVAGALLMAIITCTVLSPSESSANGQLDQPTQSAPMTK